MSDEEEFSRLRGEAKRKGWTLEAPTKRHPGYLLTSGKPGEKDARIAFGAAGPVLTLAEVEQWLKELPKG
ncbi:hypothetical protein [Kineococcus rhizosphaerae]|uniref:Uncharacterized protein n=1 Tax=Kineococcus rhizosphaerae TaxID=559628 RepID=A0A2T0QZD5_9ACTN|nr:hypothetical protein [Kineococcus rhizosphaerae]PRY12057.1 hypothetical protein CLV37_11113 [Kineococcus rhizosphaerae]